MAGSGLREPRKITCCSDGSEIRTRQGCVTYGLMAEGFLNLLLPYCQHIFLIAPEAIIGSVLLFANNTFAMALPADKLKLS